MNKDRIDSISTNIANHAASIERLVQLLDAEIRSGGSWNIRDGDVASAITAINSAWNGLQQARQKLAPFSMS